MVVRTDQLHAEIGCFICHRLCLSKFKWDNNQMFLKIPSDHVSLELEGYNWFVQTILIVLNEVEFVFTITNLYQLG